MIRRFMDRLVRDESGATAIEYGLIISLIFLAIVGTLHAFGAETDRLFQRTATALRNAMGG